MMDLTPRWYRRHAWLLLLLTLTLLGGALRFAWLDRPPLWGDEAMTFSRVSGSYQDMLVRLQDDGFPPFHYWAYWQLAQHVTLTPFWMRFIPALAGTLMIPAMYAFSRQFVGRRTALLVAAYTAASAYLLVYSRDAKMYMHFWLLVVLHLTCLIAWFRAGRRLLWWAWIAAGIAMLGTSMIGVAVLALGPLLLLTQRRVTWWRSICYVLGIAIVAAGPVAYYTQFNQWIGKVRENSRRTGITWVEPYNADRTGPGLIQYTAAAFLLSWEWPTPEDLLDVPRSVAITLKITVTALLGLIAMGLLPWPRAWIARCRAGIEPPWRSALWLIILLIVPAYGFYRASMPDAVWPHAWALWIARHPAALLMAAMLISAWIAQIIARPQRGVRALLEVPLVLALGIGLLYTLRAVVPAWDYSVWMPRYLGFVWPAFAVVLCLLIARLPTRPLRALAIVLLIAANLAQFSARVFAPTEPPLPLAAADIIAGEDRPDNPTRTYNGIIQGGMGAPATTTIASIPMRYYLCILNGKMDTPAQLRESFYRHVKLRQLRHPRELQRDLQRDQQLRTAILWRRTEPMEAPYAARLLPELPDGWRLSGFNVYPLYDHWKWLRVSTWYRWQFTRDPSAAPETEPPPDGNRAAAIGKK